MPLIDINLDEFQTEDLLDELESRFDRSGIHIKSEILEFCKKIVKESRLQVYNDDEASIIDLSKIEYFLANHQHFSEEQLRNMINKA